MATDGVCSRIDDEDLIADQEIVVASPLGIDHEHFRARERIETHALRHPGSYPHRHVEMHQLHLVLPDDGIDLGALLVENFAEPAAAP